MRSKALEFYTACYSEDYDLIGITETWLTEGFFSAEYFPNCYAVFRCDRRTDLVGRATGGGVLLAVRSTIGAITLDMSHILNLFSLIDIVGVKCIFNNCFVMHIFVIYVPPDISIECLGDFFECFEQFIINCKNIVILGDFNITHFSNPNIDDGYKRYLLNFMDFSSLCQCNNVLNQNNRLLDLVLSHNALKVTKVTSPLLTEDIHHPSLLVLIPCNVEKRVNFPSGSGDRSYNFKRANYPGLYHALITTDWSFLNDVNDVNIACKLFYEKLYSLLDLYVPLHKPQGRRYPIWYTSEIIRYIRLKAYYFKQSKKPGNVHALNQYRILRTVVREQIKIAYENYVRSTEASIFNDPRKFWSFLHCKKGESRIPCSMYLQNAVFNSPQAIVDGFGQYFADVYVSSDSHDGGVESFCASQSCHVSIHSINGEEVSRAIGKLKDKMTAGPDNIPSFFIRDCGRVLSLPITIICNLSLSTATFPDVWKTAKICPVLKNGSSNNIQNYRPISIINNFAKIFESVLYARIYPLVANSISADQHGFMERRSTVTGLAGFVQYTLDTFDGCGQVDAIYTDISKAFDRIDHDLLLQKLRAHGFGEPLIAMFATYLSNRTQYVCYSGFKSRQFIATSGVPQGSNLGPLLFLLFINDVVELLGCDRCLFADDLKMCTSVKSEADCGRLQEQLDAVVRWCASNRLDLNISKCTAITFTRKRKPLIFDYTINNILVQRTSVVRDLGVYLDASLSFSTHRDYITSAATKMLGFLIRNSVLFQECTIKLLYFAYVRSRLEYCSLIWNPHYMVHIDYVERVQRRFLKYLHFKAEGTYPPRGYDHRLLLQRFDLLSLEVRRRLQQIKFVYGLVHNKIDSSSLLSQLPFLVPRPSARQTVTFYAPYARLNSTLSSPIVSMCRVFNSLPSHCDINYTPLREILAIATDLFT